MGRPLAKSRKGAMLRVLRITEHMSRHWYCDSGRWQPGVRRRAETKAAIGELRSALDELEAKL